MGWIGLHIGEHHDPHCTLAWWPKTNVVLDAKARHLLKKPPPSWVLIEQVPCRVTDRAMFGPQRNLPVVLLEKGTAALKLVRRSVQEFSSSQLPWRPHVTLNGMREPGDGMYIFTHIGIHTMVSAGLDPTKARWRHEYIPFKKQESPCVGK